ncbi:MAG: putative signal transducing protein [Verrucomicrobia bacterium]|nr:MAG: putative signal transducing protein [Verrucomicrobiota bacterium]
MKTIASFWKTEEAHLLRLRLAAAGIPSFLQDENITQMHPWRAAAIGGVRVQVDDSYLASAQKILSGPFISSAEHSPPTDPDALECCSCQAIIPQSQTRCFSCGWSYEDPVKD